MANKEHFNKDKKKRSSRDFRELEDLKEPKKRDYENKEISVIMPVESGYDHQPKKVDDAKEYFQKV